MIFLSNFPISSTLPSRAGAQALSEWELERADFRAAVIEIGGLDGVRLKQVRDGFRGSLECRLHTTTGVPIPNLMA